MSKNTIKKLLAVIAAVTAVLMVIAVLAACSKQEPTDSSSSSSSAPETEVANQNKSTDDSSGSSSNNYFSNIGNHEIELETIVPVKVADNTIHIELPTMAPIKIDSLSTKVKALDSDYEVDQSTGAVTLPSNVLFASDSAEISDEGKASLKDFIDAYTEVILSDDSVSTIVVEGHTDTNGTHEYNQTLSEKRANAVKDYCIEQHPELEKYMEAKGCSYDYPIYKDDGSVDMDASRRVVFYSK